MLGGSERLQQNKTALPGGSALSQQTVGSARVKMLSFVKVRRALRISQLKYCRGPRLNPPSLGNRLGIVWRSAL